MLVTLKCPDRSIVPVSVLENVGFVCKGVLLLLRCVVICMDDRWW